MPSFLTTGPMSTPWGRSSRSSCSTSGLEHAAVVLPSAIVIMTVSVSTLTALAYDALTFCTHFSGVKA